MYDKVELIGDGTIIEIRRKDFYTLIEVRDETEAIQLSRIVQDALRAAQKRSDQKRQERIEELERKLREE